MRSCTLMLAICVLVPSAALTQHRWERDYGGAADEYGYSVQQTQDGGYVVAGYTYSFGNGQEVYLVNTNAAGDTLRTRNYGWATDDWGRSVRQTQDGGYVIAGATGSSGNSDVCLVRVDTSGYAPWTFVYGGTGNDGGYCVWQTQDGGYIVAGYTSSFGDSNQVYLIKTDTTGAPLWNRRYGGPGAEIGFSVRQTQDGGYIVAGYTTSFGNGYEVYLVKTNASGDTLWTKCFGGTGDDLGWSVQQTSDTGHIVVGSTRSFGDSGQVYLVKTNPTGDTLWTRTYGGTGNEGGWSVRQTQDGGYIVAGYTTSFGNGNQVYLVKTNASGDTLWTRTYGGTSYDCGFSVQQTRDGGYVVAGRTTSFGNSGQVYLIKTDANGNIGVEETPSAEVRTPSRGATVLRRLPAGAAVFDAMGRRAASPKPGVYFVQEKDSRGRGLASAAPVGQCENSRATKVVLTR